MAIKSAAQLAAENTADFPDNTIGAITPAILRAFNQDMIDSTVGISIGLVLAAVAAVDFSVAGDTQIPILLPAGFTRYRPVFVIISNASASLVAATAGLFTAAGGGGVAIVTAASAITVSTAAENTNNNTMQFIINNLTTQCYNAANLFFRVAATTAGTGKVVVGYEPLS